jgi:hypothetical protein
MFLHLGVLAGDCEKLMDGPNKSLEFRVHLLGDRNNILAIKIIYANQ